MAMLKLYKRIARKLHYHEAWDHRGTVTEHWGVVGERGESAEHKRNKKLSAEQDIHSVLAKPLAAGYEPFDEEKQKTLLIEYTVNGFGAAKDLDKRHELESLMDETLGWTGLGHCDGGSIGSGTMEVCCFVVDFKIAKRVIAAALKGSKFADYSRIVDEESDPLPAVLPADGPVILAAPWERFAEARRGDAIWKTGEHAAYLAKFYAWFDSMPKAPTLKLLRLMSPEPKGWRGFYAELNRRK